MTAKSPKKITALTAEQIAKFPAYVEKWTNIGLSTEPADRPRAEAAIRLMYERANMEPPSKIVWCASPLSMALTRYCLLQLPQMKDSVGASVRASIRDSVGASVGASIRDSIGDSVWASVRASIRDSVRASVRASIRDSIGDSVWANVGDSIGASVWANVGDSIGASVWANVGDSIGDSVWASVRASIRDSVRASVRDNVGARVGARVRASVWDSVGASVYGQHDANWLGFYDYFAEELGLTEQTQRLDGLWEFARSAGWALPFRDICFISERHTTLLRDEQGRLHNESGPAIAYPDGWEIFSFHGVRVPAQWITDKPSLTAAMALGQENVELRRAACEIVGWDAILTQLDARTIERDEDPMVGELVEVSLPEAGRERFLRVTCGTGRRFAIPVPPTMTTALQANAWTFGYDDASSFIKPEIRT